MTGPPSRPRGPGRRWAELDEEEKLHKSVEGLVRS